MKKSVLSIALIAAAGMSACNQSGTPAETAASVEAAAGAVALETTEQRLSYGIAYNFAQRMSQEGIDLDLEAFKEGMTHAASGVESRLSPQEIADEMTKFQEQAQASAQAQQAELAEANAAMSAAFLAENATADGVQVTDSGLQYQVLTAGEGEIPSLEDQVEVHYRGTLVDGQEFDSSYARNETVTFGVTQVIPGWTEALQMMPVGSKWKLAIPPELAYGNGGAAGGLIGPNAALIFEVELIAIAEQQEAAAEPAEG